VSPFFFFQEILYLKHKSISKPPLNFLGQDEVPMADLDEVVSLRRGAVEKHPPGNSNRSTSLGKLALSLCDRFKERGQIADLEEAIQLKRAVLELHRPGHPGRAASLKTLGVSLCDRFNRLGVITDLDEGIIFKREALERYPRGHPDRPAAMKTLAVSLRDRFKALGDGTDLDAAIALSRDALDVLPPGHPDRVDYLGNITRYLRMKAEKLGVSDVDENDTPSGSRSGFLIVNDATVGGGEGGEPSPLETVTEASQTGARFEQVIQGIIADVLERAPPRLLDTGTGLLCDRFAQVQKFKRSPLYRDLLKSMANCDSDQATDVLPTVTAYFQFVTLSHRWGNSEPLLREIQGRVIYKMTATDGLTKLQSFCRVAEQHKYQWAWSDTCCIDKESSAELQEAIGSMFSWYRQSALTIVCLSDVSTPDSFAGSAWFKRGWTLQELLAPRTILFYRNDWSLYHTSLNHKEDGFMLNELAKATSIAPRHLREFCPGMDNPRSKLLWASDRRTTRSEDIAYSLFGIFDLHLPVIYGESADKSLGRLLSEVVSQSGDASILDWVGPASSYHSCFPSTLTSYQMIPHPEQSLDDVQMERSISRIRGIINPGIAHSLLETLTNFHPPQCINRRLTLPCIVYHVREVVSNGGEGDNNIYDIHASGLRQLRISCSDELKEGSFLRKNPYVLVRLWDPWLSVEDDTDAAWKLMVHLEQPFRALLLAELPHGKQFKRIASSCAIIAYPEELGISTALGEPTILDIT